MRRRCPGGLVCVYDTCLEDCARDRRAEAEKHELDTVSSSTAASPALKIDDSNTDGAALLRGDPSAAVTTEALPDAVTIAELFHQHYEQLAPHFGYVTRPESQVPWERLPEANRSLMVRTVECVLHDLRMPWITGRKADVGSGNQDASAERAPSTGRSAAQK